MTYNNLRAKVGDPKQFASVRRIVLDEGVERGVAALAFSNGNGLDFWALGDRSLDIGPLWWKGMLDQSSLVELLALRQHRLRERDPH